MRPPTPGVVSRGIALEGFCSILAGLWGSGTGSTTLTENVHTIDITKVASRRVVELGAAFMILFSFMGKATKLDHMSHSFCFSPPYPRESAPDNVEFGQKIK